MHHTQQNIHGSVTGCGRQHPVTDPYTVRYRPGKIHVEYRLYYTDLCSSDRIQVWYRYVIRVCNRCVFIQTVFTSLYVGVPTKNPRTNKLDSSMLKSKDQVTLFVNYSYNNFYDFRSSENK